MSKAVEIFADSARGIYIPQHFAESVNHSYVFGVSVEQWEVLLAGPDHADYWDVWNDVEQNAFITLRVVERGVWRTLEYRLHQDGDLFLICDALLTDAERAQFFEE